MLSAVLPRIASLDSLLTVQTSLRGIGEWENEEAAQAVLDAIKEALAKNTGAGLRDNFETWTIGRLAATDQQKQQAFLAHCINALKNHFHLPVARETIGLVYQRGCSALHKLYSLEFKVDHLTDSRLVDGAICGLLWSQRGVKLTEHGPQPEFDLYGLDHALTALSVRQYLAGLPGDRKPSGFLELPKETRCQLVTGQSDTMKEAVMEVFDEFKRKDEYAHLDLEAIEIYGSIIIRKNALLPMWVNSREARESMPDNIGEGWGE